MADQHRSFSKEIIRFQNEKTFEKLLQITLADIETLMEIAPKNRLPLFLEIVYIIQNRNFEKKIY